MSEGVQVTFGQQTGLVLVVGFVVAIVLGGMAIAYVLIHRSQDKPK
jgi:hypothetical protein